MGTVVPANEVVDMADRHGAVVHVDGARAVSHMPVDVQSLDCDFYTFPMPQEFRANRNRGPVGESPPTRGPWPLGRAAGT
jgi:hypothetical protein